MVAVGLGLRQKILGLGSQICLWFTDLGAYSFVLFCDHLLLLASKCVLRQRLHAEVYDSATNLHSFVVARQERCALLYKHESTKFALIIFQHEFSVLKLDLCVAATYGNVVDSEV